LTGFVVCHSRTNTWGSAAVLCLTPVLELLKEIRRKKMKTLMWRASDITYPQAWKREISAIKEVDDEAFKHLITLLPRRAF